jgi:cyanophycin synthetase
MPVTVISNEVAAIEYAMQHARKGAFIVVSSDDIKTSINFLKQQQEELMPLSV